MKVRKVYSCVFIVDKMIRKHLVFTDTIPVEQISQICYTDTAHYKIESINNN